MITEMKTPQSVLAFCREMDVKSVTLRFTDLPGRWQQTSVPVSALDEDAFEDGYGIDGSGLPGWRPRDHGDLLLVPQPTTAFFDPFASLPTLNLIAAIQDPITRDDYGLDPRSVARRAEAYLAGTGLAEQALFGPEPEFFVFDQVRYQNAPRDSFYAIDGGKSSMSHGCCDRPVVSDPPWQEAGDAARRSSAGLADVRGEIMQTLINCGVQVESQHQELATESQCGIGLRRDGLLRMSDMIMMTKYVVKNVAARFGKTATFMPKPLRDEYGSGMHTHFSFWKAGEATFAGSGYAGLSEAGLGALGGILHHAPALLALTNPSTNSFKRLVPQFDAPIYLTYSQLNRASACRVPMYSKNPKAKRIEFRCPDGSANPYLAFSAILMAAIDGIQNKLSPGDAVDVSIDALGEAERSVIARTPTSLSAALTALEEDHDFLLRGDVFTAELIQTWIDYKRSSEIEAVRACPTPQEFALYYDV